MITREQLRGKPLDTDCKTIARVTTYLYSVNDNREFCYGLLDPSKKRIAAKCLNCKAYAYYEKENNTDKDSYS